MRGILTAATFISVIAFPWPFAAALAIATASLEPLVPLAAGLFAETLYYVPHDAALPVYTICGAALTIISSVVHSRLRAGTIGQ